MYKQSTITNITPIVNIAQLKYWIKMKYFLLQINEKYSQLWKIVEINIKCAKYFCAEHFNNEQIIEK